MTDACHMIAELSRRARPTKRFRFIYTYSTVTGQPCKVTSIEASATALIPPDYNVVYDTIMG
jgi:hypothetical protein